MSKNSSAPVKTPEARPSWKAWYFWVIAVSLFGYQFFARVSVGVLEEDLTKAFLLTPETFGLLAAGFYHAYGPLQLPVGVILDRFNLKMVLLWAIGLCTLGCTLFAFATNLSIAYCGRFLIGFGASFGYLASLKVASLLFPSRLVPLLTTLTSTIGMLGPIAAGIILPKAVAVMPWKEVYLYFILVGVVLFLMLAVLDVGKTLEDRKKRLEKVEGEKSLLDSVKIVLAHKATWIAAGYAFLAYMPLGVLFDVWGVKFLKQTYGLDGQEAALIATSMGYLGFSLGGPLFAMLVNSYKNFRGSLMITSFLSASLFCFVLHGGGFFDIFGHPGAVLGMMFFLCGATLSGQSFIFNVAFNLHPLELSGTVGGVLNAVLIIGGGFFANWSVSRLLSMGIEYKWAFSIVPLSLVCSGLLIWALPRWALKVERQVP
jgi:sugar phosphate permease